jgi:ATP-binding cassette subfamily C (CFTR/MRP) protein 1
LGAAHNLSEANTASMSIPFYEPNPAPPTERNQQLIPEIQANILERVTLGWIFPLLSVSPFRATKIENDFHLTSPILCEQTGYTRPIEETDVWHLEDARLTSSLSDQLERNFYSRCPPRTRPVRSNLADVTHPPDHLTIDSVDVTEPTNGSGTPADQPPTVNTRTDSNILSHSQGQTPSHDTLGGLFASDLEKERHQKGISRISEWFINLFRGTFVKEMDEHGQQRYYDSSLLYALIQTTWRSLLVALCCRIFYSVLITTSSLLTKQLVDYIATSHTWATMSDVERESGGMRKPQSIAYGIGLALGLALMQEAASVGNNHYLLRSQACGAYHYLPS